MVRHPRPRSGTAALVVAPFIALAVACGGPSTPPPDVAVDLDHEQDVLFSCAQQEVEQIGFEVAVADTSMRRVQSAWVPLDVTGLHRGRVVVEVFVDPWQGPGLTVRSQQQRWQGAPEGAHPDARVLVGAHDETTVGWRSLPRTEDDAWREGELVDAIRSCWSTSRDPTAP